MFLGLLLLLSLFLPAPIRAATPASSPQRVVFGENPNDQRIDDLQRRVSKLENPGPRVGVDLGGVAFLFGIFCALWAQNTGRGPWLWFFLGFFFTFVAAIILLVKNANDRKSRLWHEREERFHPPGSAPLGPRP